MEEKGLKVLVQKMQSGEQSCFDEIFNETKKLIFYNIYSIVKSYEVSEDLMQDTFVKFLENYQTLDTTKSISGYLMTISRNLALNYIKKESKMTDLDNKDFLFESKDAYKTDEEELLTRIREILSLQQFDIFVLHVYGELTFAQIAKYKKIPLSTAIWIYNSGIKKLRKELVEYETN